MQDLNEELITLLKQINQQQEDQIKSQAETIEILNSTISDLQASIVNLNETIDELKRKLFGKSSEKKAVVPQESEDESPISTQESVTTQVQSHTRTRKKKSVRADLYEALPIRDVKIPVPDKDRICPDCDAPMQHVGYHFVREELRITPARVERIRYLEETVMCPVCKAEDDSMFVRAKAPAPLMVHSPASASMVAEVMYRKSCLYLPFYRQEKDWKQQGVPLPRETAANWYNTCALKYLLPVYTLLHQELLKRDVIHADEIPCQVLNEPGKDATSKSYMWIYLSGTDGLPCIVLYDYCPGRSGNYPIEFLKGYSGYIHCDGYAAYGRIEDVMLLCCLAHCRRKFFEAIPKERRNKVKLLDINSDQSIPEPAEDPAEAAGLLPAERGVAFCNRLFFLERCYKDLSIEDRKQKRLEKEPDIWNSFWNWLDQLSPSGGSKLEKAVNYAKNHKAQLMNYLQDGRCEISNNAAERRAKSYATARKNFLFHGTQDGATASAIVMSLVETAKANNLNIFQYLYTLLLYMPDYTEGSAGIELLLPWSDFIKKHCTGLKDTESNTPENREELPA